MDAHVVTTVYAPAQSGPNAPRAGNGTECPMRAAAERPPTT